MTKFLIEAEHDLLHQLSISGVYKDVPQESPKVSSVPAKYLPRKSVILGNIGGNFGFEDILNTDLPPAVEYPPRQHDVIGSIHDPPADGLMRVSISKARILDNARADEQRPRGKAPAAPIRCEVHLPGAFPLIQIERRSCFPGCDDPFILTLGRDLSTSYILINHVLYPGARGLRAQLGETDL